MGVFASAVFLLLLCVASGDRFGLVDPFAAMRQRGVSPLSSSVLSSPTSGDSPLAATCSDYVDGDGRVIYGGINQTCLDTFFPTQPEPAIVCPLVPINSSDSFASCCDDDDDCAEDLICDRVHRVCTRECTSSSMCDKAPATNSKYCACSNKCAADSLCSGVEFCLACPDYVGDVSQNLMAAAGCADINAPPTGYNAYADRVCSHWDECWLPMVDIYQNAVDLDCVSECDANLVSFAVDEFAMLCALAWNGETCAEALDQAVWTSNLCVDYEVTSCCMHSLALFWYDHNYARADSFETIAIDCSLPQCDCADPTCVSDDQITSGTAVVGASVLASLFPVAFLGSFL